MLPQNKYDSFNNESQLITKTIATTCELTGYHDRPKSGRSYFITGLECDVMIADKNETSSSRIPLKTVNE